MKYILIAETDDGELVYSQESKLVEVIEMSIGSMEKAVAKYNETQEVDEDNNF